MSLVIEELQEDQQGGTELRGAVKEMWSYKGPEAMVAGPAETGKSYGTLTKVHALLLKYPGCQGAILRQTYQSLQASILQTYEKKILGPDLYKKVIKPYGGERPEWYDYPNGSRLWVGGLDNPDKVLSSERDFIYVNQAEEITLKAWEYLLTRTTGRAGNMPYSQVFGDCNPGPPTHWIINRPSLKVFHSKHEDNPTLFDSEGNILEQGRRSLAVLDSLTGMLLQRLRFGRWVGAEGIIYTEFDHGLHVCDPHEVPPAARIIELVDFGYTHPFTWQRWHIDYDGRIYIVKEVYATQTLVEDHCRLINRITTGMQPPEVTLCDWDAEDRATYEKYRGLKTKPAEKAVTLGIQAVQARLRIPGDGRSRFNYVRGALEYVDKKLQDSYLPTSCLEEVGLYVWNEKKDAPVKEFDHGMDLWKYGVHYLDKPKSRRRKTGSFSFG